ncbi:hypothetical protein [Herbaspirillum sp. RV1423]|uniref:hypothetical protein n=1 Tax=Herbaspirillum sp. RV1423 TaxID=1443993 RepID=UPI0004AD1BB8|nr:hypothetical protein [Herbaspirillum sp. RV1423]
MSQGSLILPTTGTVPGLTLVNAINSALANLSGQASGATDPSTLPGGVQPFSFWMDISVTPNVLRMRNSANTAWVSPIGLAASGANVDITSLGSLASINGGALAGLRNLVINGGMAVDQVNMGANQTITAGAGLVYTVDQFYAYCSGANVTGAQVAGPFANTYRYQLTGAASNTSVGFGTRIEANNSASRAGSTASLSVALKSSSLTSITWTAYYANTKDSFGTPASPNRTQFATGTFTIGSTESTYNAQISIPGAAVTGLEIAFSGGALAAGQTLTIGNVQLEPGNVATPFEQRPYGLELSLCQRYFEKSFQNWLPASSVSGNYSSASSFIVNTAAIITNGGFPGVVLYKAAKRVNPTVTTYDLIGQFGYISTVAVGGAVSHGNTSIVGGTDSGFSFGYSAPIAQTGGVSCNWTSSARM